MIMVSQKLLGTKLQVVWPDLIVRWSQEAYGGVQGLSELVMSSVEHRCHAAENFCRTTMFFAS